MAATRKSARGRKAAAKKRTVRRGGSAAGKKKVRKKAAAAKRRARKPAQTRKTATRKKAARKTAARKTAARKSARKTTTAKKKATSARGGRKTAARKKPARTKKTPARKKAASAARRKPSTTAKSKARKTSTRAGAPRSTTRRSAGSLLAGPGHGIKPYQPRRGEEYMGEAQRAHFTAILRAWKRELMEEVDRTVHHMKDEAANFPDPNDRATQESEFSLELRTRDRERKLIKKIDEALGTVESGDYGFCESCGVEIGIRRLEARPTATLCIDCKTLDEIREKQMGG